MVICSLCELAQTESEQCTQCGKRFSSLIPEGSFSTALIEDLETTQLPEVKVISEVIAEIDWGRYSKVTVQSTQLADREDHRAEASVEKTIVPTEGLTCRYCRNVQKEGRSCDKCGMRLPVFRSVIAVGNQVSTDWLRCPRCRIPGKTGTKCRECGQELLDGQRSIG